MADLSSPPSFHSAAIETLKASPALVALVLVVWLFVGFLDGLADRMERITVGASDAVRELASEVSGLSARLDAELHPDRAPRGGESGGS